MLYSKPMDYDLNTMSRRTCLAALVAFAASNVATETLADLDTLKPINLPSPKTDFMTPNGEITRLSDFISTPLVINFWATWCAPCVHELPSLARLHQRLAQENMGVLLIGVDRDGAAVGMPFLEKLGIISPHQTPHLGFDPKGVLARSLKIRALPTSFLMNSEGVLVAHFEGVAVWDKPDVISTIRRHFNA